MAHPYQSLATDEEKASQSVVDLAPLPIPLPLDSKWARGVIWIILVPLVIVVWSIPIVLYDLYGKEPPGGVAVAQVARAEWSRDELELRKYRWGYHPPDPSLGIAVGSLGTEERAVREWLLKSRVMSGAGVGIGLGREDRLSTRRKRPAPLAVREEGATALRALNDIGGSARKYRDLEEERDTGHQATMCKAENTRWQPEYTALHSGMMNGSRDAWLLETTCSVGAFKDCGGLSDRLLGIASATMWAILTKRSIAISWQNEPIDLLFDSANVDWSQPYKRANPPPHPIYDSKFLRSSIIEFFTHNFKDMALFRLWEQALSDWQDRGANASRWVMMDRANRGVVLRLRGSTAARPAIDTLGLTEQSSYSCLIDYLFRPKADTLRLISEYTSFFSLPTVFSVGIQIRLGDQEMAHPELTTSIENHRHFFDCAAQMAAERALPDQRVVYYLVSDSRSLKKSAVEAYPGKVIVSGLEPHHAEIEHPSVTVALDGQHNAVAEMWTMRDMDFHIISGKGSFGKIPTWLHGGEGAISLPMVWSDSEPKIECSSRWIKSLTDLAKTYASG